MDTGIEGVVGIEGLSGQLAATEAAVTRFRTALEASRGYHFGSGLSLQPSLEVGLRRDAGDAETGAGVDLGGGLVVKHPLTGLSADVQIRMLLVHQAEGFGERGGSVRLSLGPNAVDAAGLQGAGDTLLGRTGYERSRGAVEPRDHGGAGSRRIRPGPPASMPISATACRSAAGWSARRGSASVLPGMARDYRLGYQLTLLHDDAVYFALGVDATRRQSLRQQDEDHRVLGRVTTRW